MADHELNINGFNGSDYKIGIVTANFNSDITSPMLDECISTLRSEFLVPENNITSVRVAGAADTPAVISAMAKAGGYDAIIVMGAVIRGATAHFDYVSNLVTDAVKDIQVQHALPVAFGVIMCDTREQAEARIILGKEFADAAMQSARTIRSLN